MARASDEFTEAHTGMSGRSSSGSWPGGGERAADIIDLDRYMRGSVRPHGRHRGNDECDRLVVDAGGPTAAPGGPPLGGPTGGNLGGPAPSPRSKSSSTNSVPRDKRYSHDSGLSDGSYNARRRMQSRRVVGDHATTRAHRDHGRGREMVKSSHSMRNFRVACERALKDQQEQIARMAQLCERLTVKNERGGRAAPKQTSVSVTQDSSDISSSSLSRSSRDKSRKDKHRTNECKTYKIIMNKLDELNRMFATRNRSIPPRRKAIAPARVSSAGSVSVSDKLVSTEPMDRHHASRPPRSIAAYAALTEVRPVLVTPRTPLSAIYSNSQRRAPSLVERGVGGRSNNCRSVITRLATTQAHELDIAPVEAAPPRHSARSRSGRLNVATESVVEYDSDADGSKAQAPHCKFDLDNPLHLYEQSKRLQSPQKRVRSLDRESARPNPTKSNKSRDNTHHISLCRRCHGYWRALTALATQLIYGGSGSDRAPAS